MVVALVQWMRQGQGMRVFMVRSGLLSWAHHAKHDHEAHAHKLAV